MAFSPGKDGMSKGQLLTEELKSVKYFWRDEIVEQLTGLDRLVYRSNKLGEDLTLTNTGGGNTSSKLIEPDPLWSSRAAQCFRETA